uniref:Uncharacterized protein n=1 Tax=Rousettus aegyptiacus TaxID=9407 RepID=A0A7J8H0Z3_ROUAE|nr:hypothetical protein HJG63_011154 [Rousettus aegyptiacus]
MPGDGDVGPERQGRPGPRRRLRPSLRPPVLVPAVGSTPEPVGTARGQAAVGTGPCGTKQRGATARDLRPAERTPDQWDEASRGHPTSDHRPLGSATPPAPWPLPARGVAGQFPCCGFACGQLLGHSAATQRRPRVPH